MNHHCFSKLSINNFLDLDEVDSELCNEWLRLASTPISSNRDVIALQRHLATAAKACKQLSSQLSKAEVEGAQLQDSNELVTSLRNSCDEMQCKYEGTSCCALVHVCS